MPRRFTLVKVLLYKLPLISMASAWNWFWKIDDMPFVYVFVEAKSKLDSEKKNECVVGWVYILLRFISNPKIVYRIFNK